MSHAADWIRERPVAHRGLHDATRPENSMTAFEAGLRAGHPLELDVHVLRDDAVVIFHDETTERMTGVDKPVREVEWGDLADLRLLGTDQAIPRLRDLLDLVAGAVPLLIEIKNPGPIGRWEQALWGCLRDYDGPFAVQSFNPFSLGWFRKHAPHVPRGQLSTDFRGIKLALYKRALLRRMAFHPLARPDFVGYDLRCLPFWPTSFLRRRGVPLLAWTVRSEEDRARAMAVADNYIFEHVRPLGPGAGASDPS